MGYPKGRMLVPGETFSKSYPATADSVAEARRALAAFADRAGADDDRLEAIRLAASEAVTNAILHAYRSDQSGTIQISASYVKDEVWLLIGDAGSGLRARSNSSGLGLGLAVIAQLADEFQILSRGSGGTELRMRFKLAAPPDQAPERRSGDQSRGSRSTASSPA
jgi:anti-sigma regulatory factor (Ser/Thr protein kinase)